MGKKKSTATKSGRANASAALTQEQKKSVAALLKKKTAVSVQEAAEMLQSLNSTEQGSHERVRVRICSRS
jgi:hypothetical protein